MNNFVDNLSTYQAEFANYLANKKYGVLSVKSYLSDLAHYLEWIGRKTSRTDSKLSKHNLLSAYFHSRALEQYFEAYSLEESNNTIKRRLAGLSCFLKFAVDRKWLDKRLFIFFQTLADKYQQALKTNQKALDSFIADMVKNGAGKNTVRSYRTDISEFLIIS
jgi:site-specific recombinase XerD